MRVGVYTMPVVKVKCDLCGQEISKSNISKHMRRHKNHPESFKDYSYALTHDGLSCQFCGKECKNRNSLCNHERLCKENPNRQNTVIEGFNNFGRTPWNKGLTKETDSRVLKQSKQESISKIGKPGHKHTESFKKKMSEIAKERHLGGFNMRRGVMYNGFKLDSTYEVILAKDLDENNIHWIRPKE